LHGDQHVAAFSFFQTFFGVKIMTLEIKNNKLDQIQGMSAKMAANGIRTHTRTNQ